MSKIRYKWTPFKVFVVVFILYFGIHMVVGYVHCVNSEYANCPGHETEIEEESDFDD